MPQWVAVIRECTNKIFDTMMHACCLRQLVNLSIFAILANIGKWQNLKVRANLDISDQLDCNLIWCKVDL